MAAYYRPETVHEALKILRAEPVTLAAGCTDLFPATERRALQGSILDITAIHGISGIQKAKTCLRIGATTTWSEIARADLPPAYDVLRQAAREVGAAQIQNSGTVGGNLCNASPAADGVPALLTLNAQVELTSSAGTRHLALSDFITGVRQTALRGDEILTAVVLPICEGRSLFSKLGARDSLVISIAMVAARLCIDEGRVTDAAIAIGACSPVATRLPELERAVIGCSADAIGPPVTADLIRPVLSPIDDIRADAAYRDQAAVTLVRRALVQLAEEAS